MQISNISIAGDSATGMALFNLGFRVFFLGAGIFSIVSISLWSAIFLFQLPLSMQSITNSQWHAHEMIYGYSIAVIAGFLLTAVKNWTGIQTLHGKQLILLFSLWLVARLLFLLGTSYLFIAGIFDILFSILLAFSVAYPIIKVKLWKQLSILFVLILLITGNILFYLGALNVLDDGVYWGIYGGLYVLIILILTMGRRVLPFFIERGVGYQVKLFNYKWIDTSILLLFIGFFVSELFINNQILSSYLALGLFLVNAIRLIGWHTKGIWGKSLLWSIYLSFWFICIGFLLFTGIHFVGVSKVLAIHAFAFGGVGVITMGMMSRVALGHTGRDIGKPHKAVGYALGILLIGAVFRVVVPLFDTQNYVIWIGISQVLWIISFLIFTIIYFPLFIKPRIDGRFG
ncbi:MAG: NnrS family protein [Gammaproteobacteria bacterium]|nr:MAG: NnrS family protein [Gammaproteobacteria bacterium]